MTTRDPDQRVTHRRTDRTRHAKLAGAGSIGCVLLAAALRFLLARQYHNAVGGAHSGRRVTLFKLDDVTRWYEISTPLLVLGVVLALLSCAWTLNSAITRRHPAER